MHLTFLNRAPGNIQLPLEQRWCLPGAHRWISLGLRKIGANLAKKMLLGIESAIARAKASSPKAMRLLTCSACPRRDACREHRYAHSRPVMLLKATK
ncbi:hypothetical protein N7536_000261 [Penicillium majusculum]|nr:hypothetical protein N7536_000261 [Penicillium majusculum]